MIAPQPFFEPRGTPFSEFHRIRALTDLGHTVDLVTYPIGQDVTLPGLRVFRSLRVPFLSHVKIGPSLAKIPLDALLTLTAIRRACSDRYDAVHSHEEGGVIGVVLAAAACACRTSTTCTRACRSSSPTSRSPTRGSIRSVFSVPRTPDDPAVACRDRDLPVARGHRARHRCRRPHRADRERPGVGGGSGDAGGRRSRPADISALASRRRWSCTRARSRRIRGSTCCSTRWPSSAARARTRGWCSREESRIRWPPRANRRGRPASADVTVFAGERPGQRDPRVPAGGRRARVAALARNQHPAQDLPVPPLGQADRRHTPPDAHAGARR